MTIRVILWDFGDTLVDERWMLAPMAGVPAWRETYEAVLGRDGLVERWSLGAVSTQDVAHEVANALGVSPASVAAHMHACSRNIAFFPLMMELSERCPLPQAIVTVNSDIFTHVVVPNYNLAARFPVIVTSWEEKTLRKADLCDVARAKLDGALERRECLLVDNKQENVVEWNARGGVGHVFRSERTSFNQIADLLTRSRG
jgi:FMN phosphatase YigB (HAD superfamily)